MTISSVYIKCQLRMANTSHLPLSSVKNNQRKEIKCWYTAMGIMDYLMKSLLTTLTGRPLRMDGRLLMLMYGEEAKRELGGINKQPKDLEVETGLI